MNIVAKNVEKGLTKTPWGVIILQKNTVWCFKARKENNYEKLAYEAVRMEITLGANEYKADDFDIQVAKREEPSGIIEV